MLSTPGLLLSGTLHSSCWKTSKEGAFWALKCMALAWSTGLCSGSNQASPPQAKDFTRRKSASVHRGETCTMSSPSEKRRVWAHCRLVCASRQPSVFQDPLRVQSTRSCPTCPQKSQEGKEGSEEVFVTDDVPGTSHTLPHRISTNSVSPPLLSHYSREETESQGCEATCPGRVSP